MEDNVQRDVDGETIDGELDDAAEAPSYALVPLDAALLTNPVVVRAVASIAIGLTVLVWPNRTDRILARLIGVAVIWLAVATIQARRRHPNIRTRWLIIVGSVVAAAAGTFLVVSPDHNARFLGRVLGALIVLVALRFAVRGRGSGTDRTWMLGAGATLAAGTVVIVYPVEMLAAATVTLSLAWIVLSLIVIVHTLDDRKDGTTGYRSAGELLVVWLADRPKSVDARQSLYDKILFEGPNRQRRIIRFFTLMGFASVIASMGVITDSTAVVIGAMLIAPLMTPLMGMAISLVMGWPNRLTVSVIIAVSGIAFAILIGVLLGLIAPTVINTATNTQIVARSTPTVLDLITALAAGAAGAYGLSRPDVSDSLPGVAIAISLVPPLSVVGIAYSQGDWMSGNGALLLFMTNMLAILVMGGITFVVTGVTPVAQVAEHQHRVRTSMAALGIAAAVVVGALLLNGSRIASNAFDQSRAERTVDDWLDPASLHRLVGVEIDGDTVMAVIVGPSSGVPNVDDLAAQLSDAFNRTMAADLRVVVEERVTSGVD